MNQFKANLKLYGNNLYHQFQNSTFVFQRSKVFLAKEVRIIFFWGAAITQWIRLRLLFCRPRFESQAHHLCFFQFIWFKLYICQLNSNVKRTKINKRGQAWPIFKKRNNFGPQKYLFELVSSVHSATFGVGLQLTYLHLLEYRRLSEYV